MEFYTVGLAENPGVNGNVFSRPRLPFFSHQFLFPSLSILSFSSLPAQSPSLCSSPPSLSLTFFTFPFLCQSPRLSAGLFLHLLSLLSLANVKTYIILLVFTDFTQLCLSSFSRYHSPCIVECYSCFEG